jgi:methyl-accepting chemotaxis protein
MNFRTKIFCLSVGGIIATGLFVAGIVYSQRDGLLTKIRERANEQGRSECAKVVKNVHTMLMIEDENSKRKAKEDLLAADKLVNSSGGVSLSEETTTWNAVNQYTKETKSLSLPKMLLGDKWVEQIRDFKTQAMVVDQIKSELGDVCTILQRVNDAGDMIRVCTNVPNKATGERAIGTYIPAVKPDGSKNPIIGKLIEGEGYNGYAMVVDDWYQTAYKPLLDKDNKVIGAIFVGTKPSNIDRIFQELYQLKLGKTGYVFLLGGPGDDQGRYILSQNGKRNGENIWNAKDKNGHPFIQSMIKKGVPMKNGESDFEYYAWQNPGDPAPRQKVAAISYFEPWNWEIGAGTYEDEFQEALAETGDALTQLITYTFYGAFGILIICSGIVYYVSKKMAKPLADTMSVMEKVAQGNYSERINITSKDEFGRMAKAINAAVENTAKAMKETEEAQERERRAQADRMAAEQQRIDAEKARMAEEAEKERQRNEEENRRREEESAKQQAQAKIEREAADKLRKKVDYLLEVVGAASQGDLTCEVTVSGNEPVDELAAAIKKMLGDLSSVIGQVTESANQFTEGARVIAESSQSLAQGSQTQSASVEQMSSSIEELARSIEAVKNNASDADNVAKSTNGLAEQGGAAVQKSVEAMELIRTSSQQISEIIQVISEIASQTNLLALNAAIEAARAGEHGMGFAVVADEVRKLAERSNQAAREISTLIKESTHRVEEGAKLSETTGESLKKIVEGVEATAAKIGQIATATIEQAANAKEVAKAIQQVTQVTEQTAAGSEEMASSSQELGAQAAALRDLVSNFRTN